MTFAQRKAIEYKKRLAEEVAAEAAAARAAAQQAAGTGGSQTADDPSWGVWCPECTRRWADCECDR
jgi:hypothetical protein